MQDHQEQINRLTEKLELLSQVHSHFSEEIEALRAEIEQLKKTSATVPPPAQAPETEPVIAYTPGPEVSPKSQNGMYRIRENKILGGVCAGMAESTGMNLLLMRFLWAVFALLFCVGAAVYLILWISLPEKDAIYPEARSISAEDAVKDQTQPMVATGKKRVDLEKYIGENIISKIGIAALIIGVGIGAKYSIDNDLISPLVRIVLGYLVGAILLVLSLRLQKKYDNFSAVLLSGALTIFYFITYAAYAFYEMFPAYAAFLMMVLFTVATVAAALQLNKQFIAHIGLVGAYAVPILISEG